LPLAGVEVVFPPVPAELASSCGAAVWSEGSAPHPAPIAIMYKATAPMRSSRFCDIATSSLLTVAEAQPDAFANL
jgi:hypothetical protein